ncbi:PDZ domain-containing protein [Corynebacterium sp. P3-F1]|nr:PDZ domain-containing protein [Corynebacterium sp. P3-F1]WKK62299.1 PDZ domain-containing protein [Corynebacterium sp. P3-F1]
MAVLLVLGGIPGTPIKLTVPFAAESAGPTFNTLADVDGTPVIQIEGGEIDETSGSLDMTTVSVRTNMTMGQALGRWLFSHDTLVPIGQVLPQNMTDEELKQHNEASFVASEAAATVAAMKHLGEPTKVIVHDVLDGTAAAGELGANDTITAVDGKEVAEPQQVQDTVRTKKPGDEVTITYTRGEEGSREVTVALGKNPEDEDLPLLGITMTSEPAGDINVTYNLNDVGGPSAGMIFSLAVIDKLSPGELNGGRNVAGTGTIDEDGSVGPIGGITHKIEGARDGGAELFLAPEKNCAEARKADSGDMVVAKVGTLDDAISAMHAFSSGQPVETCQAS